MIGHSSVICCRIRLAFLWANWFVYGQRHHSSTAGAQPGYRVLQPGHVPRLAPPWHRHWVSMYYHQHNILRHAPQRFLAIYIPTGVCYVMAFENAAGVAGLLTTWPVAKTLTTDVLVRTRVFVIVTSTIDCDVYAADVLACVRWEGRRLTQVTLVVHGIPDVNTTKH